MNLDINTLKGMTYADLQMQAIHIVIRNHPELSFVHTDLKGPAKVDGFLCRGCQLDSVVEIKTRIDMDGEMLRRLRGNEWLVSWDKVVMLMSLAGNLGIPAYGMLYLPRDGEVHVVKIADECGIMACVIRRQRTRTQYSCNGGTADRMNAFIDMTGCVTYKDERFC